RRSPAAGSSHAPTDHPAGLADLAGALEAMALEHGDGAVVDEGPLHLPPVHVVGIALDRPASEPRDLDERSGQGGGRDALAAPAAIGEEAGDPPVRQRVEAVEVGPPVLAPGPLAGPPELAPADPGRAVL